MKTTFTLNEGEIKTAIMAYILKAKGIEVKNVHLSYYQADSRDPREVSSFSATASE